MLAYAVRRALIAIPVVFGVTLITFGIIHVTAGGHIPGLQISPNLTPDQVAQIRSNLGLDRPVTTQYVDWLGRAVRGDFGRSLVDQTSVSGQIMSRLPATLELTITALLLGLLISIPMGVLGAVRRGSKVDHGLTAVSVGGFAIPQFWLGLILILIFSVQFHKWGWPSLPQSGQTSAVNGGGIEDRVTHLIMPALVLSFFYIGTWSRYLRSSMVEVLSRDYMRTALAKGMTHRRAILVHGLRNAIITLATLVGLALPYLFSGALVVEIVFGWPGVGLFAYQRALDFDYPSVLGVTTFVAFLVIMGNLLADLLYAALDPRVASSMRGELCCMTSVDTPAVSDRLAEGGVNLARLERGYWHESARRLARDRVALASSALLALFIVLAFAAPLISDYVTNFQPTDQDLLHTFQGPSGAHWLGTDELGRDTLTRLAWGARVTLGIAVLCVSVQLIIGTTVGLLAGFFGGAADMVSMRAVDSVLAFPDIFLFMLIAVLVRPTPVTMALIIALIGWAEVARLIRAEVLILRNEDYILALKSLGARNSRIVVGHILRNALPVIIVIGSVRVGQVVLIEAALDFLGLGVQPPTSSWGNMLSNAQSYFYHSAWLVILPGLMIVLTVLATNLLGNALRDALDPRLRHAVVRF